MPTRTIAEHAFTEALDAILTCAEELALARGEQLPSVRELAERVRAKPSVVRDALLQAQARGVVRIVPRVGAFLALAPDEARELVRGGDDSARSAARVLLGRQSHNILHVLDTRRFIEVELIGRSAQQRRLEDLLPAREALQAMLDLPAGADRSSYIDLDFRFHAELARPAGNDVLLVLQRSLHEVVAMHFADLPADPEQRSMSDRFHAEIYAAVAAGDDQRARREMHDHLSVAYDYLLKTLRHPPASPASSV